MNMWSDRRRRQGNRGRHPGRLNDPIKDPFDRDYGYGYSEEGRPITGIVGDDLDDPSTPIGDPKGETIHVGRIAELPVLPSQTPCPDGVHDLQPDPSEPDWIAEKCTRCPIGRLIRRK